MKSNGALSTPPVWSENKFTNLEDQRLRGTASSLPHNHVSALMMCVKGVKSKVNSEIFALSFDKKTQDPKLASLWNWHIWSSYSEGERGPHWKYPCIPSVGFSSQPPDTSRTIRIACVSQKVDSGNYEATPSFHYQFTSPLSTAPGPPCLLPSAQLPARRVYLTSDSPIWLNVSKGGDSWASMTGQKWSPWRYIITAVNASTVLLTSIWLLPAIMIDKA